MAIQLGPLSWDLGELEGFALQLDAHFRQLFHLLLRYVGLRCPVNSPYFSNSPSISIDF